MLINNNYSHSSFDQTLNKFLQLKFKNDTTDSNKNSIKIFYNNQMHNNYKIEERVIKEILCNNVQCNSPEDKLNIIFYYKNKRTCNLVMKNNLAPKPPTLQQTGTVYRFQCPFPHDIPQVYIGHSQTTLQRRLKSHLNNGSIKSHFLTQHNIKPSIDQLSNNTTIIAKANDKIRLCIKEALMILQLSPPINIQYDNFTQVLKLQSHRRINNNSYPNHHHNNDNTNEVTDISISNASSIIAGNDIQNSTPRPLPQANSSNAMQVDNSGLPQLDFTETDTVPLDTSGVSDIVEPTLSPIYNNQNISPMINNRINTLIESV